MVETARLVAEYGTEDYAAGEEGRDFSTDFAAVGQSRGARRLADRS